MLGDVWLRESQKLEKSPITMKFFMLTHIDPLYHIGRQNFKLLQIQYGTRLPC